MTKWIAALMIMAGMFAMTGAQAAPSSEGDDYGACRYDCYDNGKSYRTAAACRAECASECEPIC